jgi:hypothetical protein
VSDVPYGYTSLVVLFQVGAVVQRVQVLGDAIPDLIETLGSGKTLWHPVLVLVE